jgi:hypothetical protein
MLRRLARDPRNLPFLLALLVALVVVPEIPSPVARPSAGWLGRYVVLHRADFVPVFEPGAIARSTATVKIDAFAEIESVRVADLAERLDPLDPRRDRWISGVDGLFRARDGAADLVAAYLPATRGRIATWLRLHRAFRAAAAPRGSWRLLELEPFPTLGVPFAAFTFAFAAAGRLRRARRGIMLLAAVGAVAWLPGLINGGPGMLWPCCAALFLWIPRAATGFDDTRERRTAAPAPSSSRATAARIGAILALSLAALVPGDAVVYRAGRMIASLFCLELLAVIPWAALAPMPPRVHRRHPSWAVPAALAAAGILVVLPPALTRLRVPFPRVVSLAGWGGDEELPGIPEAVAHARALQVAPFVPIGSLDEAGGSAPPAGEARVLLREYRFERDGTAVLEAPVTVARFAPGWIDRFLAGSPVGSVERLLLEQGRAVNVRPRAPWTALLRSLPAMLVLLVLLVPPLVLPAARRPLIRLGLSGITEPASRRRTR